MTSETNEAEEENVVYSPSLITDELIAEEIYEFGLIPWFAVRRFDGGKIQRKAEVQVNDHTVKPLENSALKEKMVMVPDSWEPSTFDEAFLEGIALAKEMYVCPPERVAELEVLVAVAQSSWFLDRFYPDNQHNIPGMGIYAPIIAIRGSSGSGKKNLMNALRFSSYRPFFDVSTKRVPSLFRPLAQWKGTLMIDEADFDRGDETSEVLRYLNCRAYGVPYARQNPKDARESDVFRNFGLTVVTQRRAWADDATEDRSLTFLTEKTRNEIPTLEMDSWLDRGLALQRKLLYLRLMSWPLVDINKAARIKGLRDHRITSALLIPIALARMDPSLKLNLERTAQVYQKRKVEAKANSKDGIIVNLIHENFKDHGLGEHNGAHYVGGKNEKGTVLPLSTGDMKSSLEWTSRQVRNVVNSLQLSRVENPQRIRLGESFYRPIWVEKERLTDLFLDFVPDFDSSTS